MNYNVLNREYMLSKSTGNYDEFIRFMRGNCMWVHIYLIMKNKFPNKENLINYYLDDLSLHLVMQDKDIISLDLNFENSFYSNSRGLIIRQHEYRGKGAASLNILENFLKQNHYVIVQTINEELPFSADFGLPHELSTYEPGHAILFIYFDNRYFYYVEDHEMLNNQKVLHERDIYKVEKTAVLDAIGHYLNCILVDADDIPQSVIDNVNLSILKQTVKSYYMSPRIEQRKIFYQGRGAIRKLIDICQAGYIKSSKRPSFNEHINIYLNNAFHVFRGSRYIYFQYLSSAFENGVLSYNANLLKLLHEEIKNWSFIWSIAEKAIRQDEKEQAVKFDNRFEKYLNVILRLEDQIMEELLLIVNRSLPFLHTPFFRRNDDCES